MTEGKTFNLPLSNKYRSFSPIQTLRRSPDLAGGCAELTVSGTFLSDAHHAPSTHAALLKYHTTYQKKQGKKGLLCEGGAEGSPDAPCTLVLLNSHMNSKKFKIGNRNRECIITQEYPRRQQTQYHHSASEVLAQAQASAVLALMASGLAGTGEAAADLPLPSATPSKGTWC